MVSAALLVTALSLCTAGCELLLDRDPRIDGTWRGAVTLDDTMVQVELELTQTLVHSFRTLEIYAVSGRGRLSYPAASLAVPCTVSGRYVRTTVALKLHAPRARLPAITGEVSDDGDTITGRLIGQAFEVPITLWKE